MKSKRNGMNSIVNSKKAATKIAAFFNIDFKVAYLLTNDAI